MQFHSRYTVNTAEQEKKRKEKKWRKKIKYTMSKAHVGSQANDSMPFKAINKIDSYTLTHIMCVIAVFIFFLRPSLFDACKKFVKEKTWQQIIDEIIATKKNKKQKFLRVDKPFKKLRFYLSTHTKIRDYFESLYRNLIFNPITSGN